uniref:Uncharacterized protein n=1 Tax=Panagrolaimus davidi TaxID=227884 RepID=A0A914Q401_9BILA
MYQIQPLKNQFDTFLSEMSFNDANIYKLLETLEIYKFEKLKNSLGNYLIFTWAENQAREKAADYESLEDQQKLIK